jgi:hypothetical protein
MRVVTTKRGLWVTTTDELETIDFNGDELSTLQRCVGGYVEILRLSDSVTLWVNEEGKVIDLPPNRIATRLFRAVFKSYDIIVGDVVLTGGDDKEGNTLGLDDKAYARLLMWIGQPEQYDLLTAIK